MSEIQEHVGHTEIVVRHNGPLRVSGKFVLKDPDGNVIDVGEREMVSLCRCGHSAKKPFCDGAHKEANFESPICAAKIEL